MNIARILIAIELCLITLNLFYTKSLTLKRVLYTALLITLIFEFNVIVLIYFFISFIANAFLRILINQQLFSSYKIGYMFLVFGFILYLLSARDFGDTLTFLSFVFIFIGILKDLYNAKA